MTTFFVSRHQGAKEWINSTDIHVDHFIEHLDLSILSSGDVVIGTLPINIAADIQERGVNYVHINLNLPKSLRGKELSAAQMKQGCAQLQEFIVSRGDVWHTR